MIIKLYALFATASVALCKKILPAVSFEVGQNLPVPIVAQVCQDGPCTCSKFNEDCHKCVVGNCAYDDAT